MILALSLLAGQAFAAPRHGLAMHGETQLPPDFTHLPYVNPNAPKGGRLVLGEAGGFDNLNPFTVRGVVPPGIREWVFESLLKRNHDEAFSLYAWVARAVEMPTDRSWVEFTLDPRARFSDGTPLRAEDVIFSLEILREKGRPNHREYYAKVTRVTQPQPGKLRFHFDPAAPDREMPLIIALMPILSKAWFSGQDLTAPSLRPPLGSGPYRISEITPGRSITYRRNENHWAAGLPVNRGQNNFDEIRVDFYRDENTAFEAFKSGQFDLWEEKDPARWARAYEVNPVRKGAILREAIPHGRPSGLHGFVFNTRREIFQDIRVRRALGFLFDFEWINRNFYHGAYRRTASLFDNSALAASGPPGPEEAALLAPFAASLPPETLRRGYLPPVSDGSGHNRAGAKQALQLLHDAGWELRDGRMAHPASGAPLHFEILLVRPEEEKLALAFARSAERLGISLSVRTTDSSQYEERLRNFDFDMIIYDWYASLSPGNEQTYYWGSAAADMPGSRNYPGVRNPALDAMIAHLLDARDEKGFAAAARAMDRVLMAGHYVIPLYYQSTDNIAFSRRLGMPSRSPVYGFDITGWWRKGGE